MGPGLRLLPAVRHGPKATEKQAGPRDLYQAAPATHRKGPPLLPHVDPGFSFFISSSPAPWARSFLQDPHSVCRSQSSPFSHVSAFAATLSQRSQGQRWGQVRGSLQREGRGLGSRARKPSFHFYINLPQPHTQRQGGLPSHENLHHALSTLLLISPSSFIQSCFWKASSRPGFETDARDSAVNAVVKAAPVVLTVYWGSRQ